MELEGGIDELVMVKVLSNRSILSNLTGLDSREIAIATVPLATGLAR